MTGKEEYLSENKLLKIGAYTPTSVNVTCPDCGHPMYKSGIGGNIPYFCLSCKIHYSAFSARPRGRVVA